MNSDDLDLLHQYTRQGAEEAFAVLVTRHLNLVYSVALRVVRSPHLAEEVAQSVFADLARSADKMKPDTILTAWLYRVAYRTAVDVVRHESRRQNREQEALETAAMNLPGTSEWAQIEPFLDEGMQTLDEVDRVAVLLRYFENKPLREVGQRLGVSDDAAQKRVSRAIDRLRDFFTKRGVAIGAGGIAVAVSANAVQAAPSGLANTIAAATFAGTIGVTTTTATITKAIAMTTLQKAVVAVSVVVVVAAGIYEAYKVVRRDDQAQPLQQQPAPLPSAPSVSQSAAPLSLPAPTIQPEPAPVMATAASVTATNAADFYRKAFALYDALSDQEKSTLGDWKTEPSGDQAAQLCGKVAPILDLMHQAAVATNCDWGTGPIRLDAFGTYQPYLTRGRNLARTALWGAAHCRASDTAAAADDLLSSLQVGHDISQFAIIGFLVDTAIQGLTMTVVTENASRLADTDKARLIQALKDPRYEEDLYRAIEQEADMKHPERTGDQLPSDLSPEMVRQLGDFVREFATVLTQPEAQYQQWLRRVQAAQASNPFLKDVLSTIEGTVRKARDTVVQRTMLCAGLAVFLSGRDALSTYRDPSTGQPFQYQETADGFQLQSAYQIKGQPVTMTFRR